MLWFLAVSYVAYAAAISIAMAWRGYWSPPAAASGIPTRREITRLLVIGATGGTGQQIVMQALERGLEVTALARDPAKVRVSHPKLRVVRGDVLDPASLDAAVAGQDAVLSALGHRRLFSPSRVQSDGTRNVLHAMSKHGVQRFVCETSLGLGNSVGRMGLPSTLVFLPLFLAIYFWDKARQEQVIAASDRQWVIVRPGILTNGEKRGTYRHGVNTGSYILPGRVSRADVADFMLNQLTDDTYVGRAAGIVW